MEQWGGQSAEGGGGGEGGVGGEGGEGGVGGGGLGTHWQPFNILLLDLHNPNQGQKAVSNGGSGVDKALRAVGAVRAVRAVGAVGAEGVWAHIGRL